MIEIALIWIGWIILGTCWLWVETTNWIQRPINPLAALIIITTWPIWLIWRAVVEIKNHIKRPRW